MTLACDHDQTTSIGTGILGHLMFSELRPREIDHDREALDEARTWLSWLTAREYRGPGDTIGAARARVARDINIRPTYAGRLWNRASEMTGVAGGAYRALKRAYEDQCRQIEERGDLYRSAREALGHEAAAERPSSPLALADVAPGRPPSTEAQTTPTD